MYDQLIVELMTTHQRQHHVPRFLLKHWHTPPDNKLSSFKWAEWDNGQFIHGRHPAKLVGWKKHNYSMHRSSPLPDVSIESEFLGPDVDDPASLAHQVIVQEGVSKLSEKMKIDWAKFLVSLLYRSPVMMENIRTEGSKELALSLEEAPEEYLELRGDAPEATLREWTEKYSPDDLNDLGAKALPGLTQSPLLNCALLKAFWYMRRLETYQSDLLIGDTPLIYEGTFKTDFLVSLPVTPKIAFFASNNMGILENLFKLDEELFVQRMNRLSIRQVDQYVYATSDQQQSFIKEHLRK
jgi:hypothetical protein